MIKNKGQIKMFETLAILVIFFFLVAFGFIFYANVSKTMVKRETVQREELGSIEVAEKLTKLPELGCSSFVAEEIGSCVDLFKVKQMQNMLNTDSLSNQTKDYYYGLFGYAKIEVDPIYPDNDTIVIYDRPKPDYTSITAYQIPVVILDETSRNSRCGPEFSNAKCSFGMIKLGVYS